MVLDEEKLISLVEENKCLWSHKDAKYKDNKHKQQLWDEIGRELNVSGIIAKNKWRNLRDTFHKKYSAMNQPSGSGYKYIGWKYFNQMSFLKEVQESRPRIGNLPTCEDTFEAEYLDDDDVQVDTDHTDGDGLVSTNNDVAIAPTKKRSKEKPADNALEALLELEREKQQLLRDIEMRKSEKHKSTNYYFLNSLVEPLNSLPLVAQLNIKEQFSAILHAALREHAQNTENQM